MGSRDSGAQRPWLSWGSLINASPWMLLTLLNHFYLQWKHTIIYQTSFLIDGLSVICCSSICSRIYMSQPADKKTRSNNKVILICLAHIAPISFQTSITQTWANDVHASVVTERPLARLHKLLPRGHQRGNWRKPRVKQINLINICPKTPFKF